MGKALKIIDQLQVVEFDWKHNDEHEVGLIAEEVEKIFPEAVWKENGVVMGLKPLVLIALLVEAIKELKIECFKE
jgi:hypothetical protein